MAQENQISAEEQLKAFQTSYREMLSSRYGLDPVLANAIPLGTAQEMEEQAKAFQQSLQTASGGQMPAEVPPVPKPTGSQPSGGGNGAASSRAPLSTVNSLLGQKYKGPAGKG